ncbi:MAG TPA: VOC family protein [Candidatus Saccharimonas sp.]|nr:VOC family protein [Candidatus Saccharimonas sp.]
MANNIHLVVFPAKDLAKQKSFFNTYLGTEPYVDGDWYVGYKVGDLEVGLDPNGQAVIAYTNTDDIEADLKTLTGAGATVVMEPKDVGGGLMVAQVEVDGNVLGLRQPVK